MFVRIFPPGFMESRCVCLLVDRVFIYFLIDLHWKCGRIRKPVQVFANLFPRSYREISRRKLV